MAKKKVTPSLESLIDEFCHVSHGLWSEASRKKHRGDFGRYLAFLRRTGRIVVKRECPRLGSAHNPASNTGIEPEAARG